MLLRALILCLCCAVTFPAFAVTMEVKTGTVKLSDQPDKGKTLFGVDVGKQLKGKVYLYHDSVSGNHVVNCKAEFKNLTKNKVFVSYYVVVKDSKDQIVGATTGSLQIPPDNKIHEFDSAMIPLPSQQISNIGSYDIVIYEGDKAIGAE